MNNAFNIGSIVSFFLVRLLFLGWLMRSLLSRTLGITVAKVPTFTDMAGRKWPIAVGCIIMIAGGFTSAFANNWGGESVTARSSSLRYMLCKMCQLTSSSAYLGGRLILGFGNSFAQMCSPILLTEICHPQHRAPVTAVYNCLWNLGSVCTSSMIWTKLVELANI